MTRQASKDIHPMLDDTAALEAAIVDGYPWVNPPWGDPPNQSLLEDFRGDLVDAIHRQGLVITTRDRFDQLKRIEYWAQSLVEAGYDDFTHEQFVALRKALAP